MSDSQHRAHESVEPTPLQHAHGVRPGDPTRRAPDTGRTILVGLLGGVASAVGYVVYQRLPDEQRERLHGQVRSFVSSRLGELRSTFEF